MDSGRKISLIRLWLWNYCIRIRCCRQHSVAIAVKLQIQWQKYYLGLLIQLRILGAIPPSIQTPDRPRGINCLVRVKLLRLPGINQSLEVGIVQVLYSIVLIAIYMFCNLIPISGINFVSWYPITNRNKIYVHKYLIYVPSIFRNVLFRKCLFLVFFQVIFHWSRRRPVRGMSKNKKTIRKSQ